jgi:glycosyltransferase involved in cell wall biosynthesis
MEARDTRGEPLAPARNGSRPAEAPGALSTLWVGNRPSWLEPVAGGAAEEAKIEFLGADRAGLRVLAAAAGRADVVHVTRGAATSIRQIRRDARSLPLVVDLGGETHVLPDDAVRIAREADRTLVGSLGALREVRRREPTLTDRTSLFRAPLDLTRFAPWNDILQEPRGKFMRRFRRFHRLVSPTILYAGPYTQEGGLHSALEAVYLLRERHPDTRLAAIPYGRVDRRYLDACERRALGLGHHGVIEWTVNADELPYWFAMSDVVCLPCRAVVEPGPAKLAAAAGRPFVGGEAEPLLELVQDGETGVLLPNPGAEALAAAVEELITDSEKSSLMGRTAREYAEREFSPDAGLARLLGVWQDVARDWANRPGGVSPTIPTTA